MVFGCCDKLKKINDVLISIYLLPKKQPELSWSHLHIS